MTTVDHPSLRKSRLFLILIALVFAAPMMVAGILNLGGWQPGARGNGEPVEPQRNFVDEKLRVRLDNGQLYAWRDSMPRMTLVAIAGPGCATRCLATLTKMAAARITLNVNMSRLRLLYVGVPPANEDRDGMRNYWQLGSDIDGRLAMYRPGAPDSVSAVLVESDGTALALYPAGFDPSGLRKDLQKVIH